MVAWNLARTAFLSEHHGLASMDKDCNLIIESARDQRRSVTRPEREKKRPEADLQIDSTASLIMGATGRSTGRGLYTDEFNHNIVWVVWRCTIIRRSATDDAHSHLGSLLVGAHVIEIPDLPRPSARARWHDSNVLTGDSFPGEI